MIPIDLSKQQALHADAKIIQQINFDGTIDQYGGGDTTKFFINEKVKELASDKPGKPWKPEKKLFLWQSGKIWKTHGILRKYFKFLENSRNSIEGFWLN